MSWAHFLGLRVSCLGLRVLGGSGQHLHCRVLALSALDFQRLFANEDDVPAGLKLLNLDPTPENPSPHIPQTLYTETLKSTNPINPIFPNRAYTLGSRTLIGFSLLDFRASDFGCCAFRRWVPEFSFRCSALHAPGRRRMTILCTLLPFF